MLNMHRQFRKNGNRSGIMNRRPTDTPMRRKEHARKPPRSCGSTIKDTNPSIKQHQHAFHRHLTQSVGLRQTAVLNHDTYLNSDGRLVPFTLSQPDDFGRRTGERECLAEQAHIIRVFLRALPLDLSSLLPVFLEYGITDQASLRGVPRMAGWRRWLYSWVREGRLTELQFKMVSDGFEMLS
ncbi:hypothetical protein C8Q79DRAFT_599051 [Trametes meyenii]|nr:hypothetical protein C8Q79DRAFT_599051 [Trametes meyenii]